MIILNSLEHPLINDMIHTHPEKSLVKLKYYMNKILLLCDCHFYRLALKDFFESQKKCEMEFISLESLKDRTYSQDTVLIHLAEDNYPAILRIFENRHLCLFDNSIVITTKRLITHLSRFFDERVQFIDEQVIFNMPSHPETFKKGVKARDGLHKIDLKVNLLSLSEFLILSMLMNGLTPTTIALKTKKSIKTISAQKVNALRKLGLDNTPHSMLKIAHILCFPAALRSLTWRSAKSDDIADFAEEQLPIVTKARLRPSHTVKKINVIANTLSECSAEHRIYCGDKVDVHLSVK